jgi:HEPN domain-containing protein
MKNNDDLGQQWLKKADSDFANAELCITNGTALDTACFHCQQAAKKSLKAWLIAHNVDVEKTHELKDLIALCTPIEVGFSRFLADANELTRYAVKERYAVDFWPSIDQAGTALEQARRIYDFVKSHWS